MCFLTTNLSTSPGNPSMLASLSRCSLLAQTLCRPSDIGEPTFYELRQAEAASLAIHPRPASLHTELIQVHGEKTSERSKRLPGLVGLVLFFGRFLFWFLCFVVFCWWFWVFDRKKSLISSVADLRILCDDWQLYSCKQNCCFCNCVFQ